MMFAKEDIQIHTLKDNLPMRFYSAPFVKEYGKLEVLRSQRYSKYFSVVDIEIDKFSILKKSYKKEDILKIIKELIEVIMKTTRECDIIGMMNRKEFALILPETDYVGALIIARRIRNALLSFHENEKFKFLLASASYPHDGKNFDELLERASLNIEDYKKSLIYTLKLENKNFWECVYSLFEERRDIPSEYHFILEDAKERGEWNLISMVSSAFMNRLQGIVLKEIARTPKVHGILYISIPDKGKEEPLFLSELRRVKEIKTRIFIIDSIRKEWAGGLAVNYLNLNDKSLNEVPFILFFRKDFYYGFFCKEWNGKMTGFHTMDPFLIEGLIGKLQEHYRLQEQL